MRKWLCAAGTGRQFAPAAPIGRLRAAAQLHWIIAAQALQVATSIEARYVLATRADGTTVLRYSAFSPMRDLEGAITDMAMYAGQGVDDVKDIPAAADLVRRLWAECIDTSQP